MKNIILCGEASDTSVAGALIPALALYGGVKYAGPSGFFERGQSPEFFLYECGEVPPIGIESGILLFKNSFHQKNVSAVPKGFLCVLEAKNRIAAALLKDTSATVVTCGTSTRETLSVAALESSSAVLSLQRSLKTLDGTLLEPHDFTVKYTQDRSPHQLLTVCACLLIAGVSSDPGYIV